MTVAVRASRSLGAVIAASSAVPPSRSRSECARGDAERDPLGFSLPGSRSSPHSLAIGPRWAIKTSPARCRAALEEIELGNSIGRGVVSRMEPPGPLPADAPANLPEEIRSLGSRPGSRWAKRRVELGFIAGRSRSFAYEKPRDRPDVLSQPLLRARQKSPEPNVQPAWSATADAAPDAEAAPEAAGRRRDCCAGASGAPLL